MIIAGWNLYASSFALELPVQTPYKANPARSRHGAMMVKKLILQIIASSVFSAPPVELHAQTVNVVEIYDDNSS
jgi:hypothetical protein